MQASRSGEHRLQTSCVCISQSPSSHSTSLADHQPGRADCGCGQNQCADHTQASINSQSSHDHSSTCIQEDIPALQGTGELRTRNAVAVGIPEIACRGTAANLSMFSISSFVSLGALRPSCPCLPYPQESTLLSRVRAKT